MVPLLCKLYIPIRCHHLDWPFTKIKKLKQSICFLQILIWHKEKTSRVCWEKILFWFGSLCNLDAILLNFESSNYPNCLSHPNIQKCGGNLHNPPIWKTFSPNPDSSKSFLTILSLIVNFLPSNAICRSKWVINGWLDRLVCRNFMIL